MERILIFCYWGLLNGEENDSLGLKFNNYMMIRFCKRNCNGRGKKKVCYVVLRCFESLRVGKL